MKQSHTVTGKSFYYDGDLTQGLTVHTCDRQGKVKDEGFYISSGTIDIIKKAITEAREIPMGACRDKPAKDSIGYILRGQHKSPQVLSYVVPLLREVNFATYFKKGTAYYIRYTAGK
jgi:hypothetical protein